MNTIHKIAARFILGVAAVAITATAVLSAPITVPAGLNPGDQYRLAFVTNTTRVATSSNIADYNAFVTAVANSQTELAALGTTWMAIASTATVDARDNTGTNLNSSTGFPVYLLDETRIADNNADLWSGNIVVPFKVTQTGTSARTIEVWTGTNGDGTARSFRALGETFAVTGITNATNLLWVINGVNRAFDTPPVLRPFWRSDGRSGSTRSGTGRLRRAGCRAGLSYRVASTEVCCLTSTQTISNKQNGGPLGPPFSFAGWSPLMGGRSCLTRVKVFSD